MENEEQNPSPPAETPSPSQESAASPEQASPAAEPIFLSKLYPDAQLDLDSLFPDPQMKQLLKEVHRNRQSNQRFLKRLNLSNIAGDGEDPESNP